MTEQQNKFIAEIAPIIVKYAAQYGYSVTSVTIAQACLESGFEMRGAGVIITTSASNMARG